MFVKDPVLLAVVATLVILAWRGYTQTTEVVDGGV